ncbi:nitric oxide reductase NorD protein [Pseudochelatococcus lubricantis]|uniref:Nitric oxide reductase NorD protein n=1 Tax=Pseudochelatococcus lubricantis TaxID=1538102 RepID=A0ABX0V3N8_9HYPH|nr:nitric oxide reductase D protein [Pseudochelatococcus lubricantis]NIJ59768.1 nitric oxide reductase NorD protein [Pseudochelatococcus lubricantis]
MAFEPVEIEFWEPEESVGKLWHAFASRLDAPVVHDGARVRLAEVSGRLAVLFRGLGGNPAVELKAAVQEVSRHRLSFRRRLAVEAEKLPHASFDGEVLRLPESLAVFPERAANAALYVWLAAMVAHAPARIAQDDPLRADLAAIAAARRMTRATLVHAPGLAALHTDLAAAHLAARPRRRLAGAEARVEALLRYLLGDAVLPDHAMLAALGSGDFAAFRAPSGYRSFLPVPLWPDLRAVGVSASAEVETRPAEGDAGESGADDTPRRARRHRADLAERKDSLILHKFEALLSWAEFLNLNRRVEDDDFDNARKAIDDQEEIGLGQISKAPATRLKLHLDLAPEDVDRERLAGAFVYPEWDTRAGSYLQGHVRVLAAPVAADPAHAVSDDPAARRRIRAVRRQFEAMRPGRVLTAGQLDGDELDMDAALRAVIDLAATGRGNDRVWRQARPMSRDLAVSILLDVSRSTESAVAGRAVIEIEREALAALAWGLDACGDSFAIHGFSSLRRDRVYLHDCKDFAEPMSREIEGRIAALRPGFYTRLGAAVRHASAGLATQPKARRLLIVITDGKPNDLDHYEGRHGIEDSAMAVREARRAGQAVFGITVDREGKAWFARLFGRGGYAVIRDPDRLTGALPEIYRQLVA